MADILTALLLAAVAPAAAPACAAGACPVERCGSGACSSSSLSFSALHQPDGVHAPASSLEVLSWSWGASQPGSARDAGSGMATGKRTHKPVGKVAYSDLSLTKAPSSAVSSVGSLSAAGSGAAAASYARSSPPACSAASGACPGTVSVQLASSRKGWDGCVKGSHIASAQLRGASSDIHLGDVTVEECDNVGGRMTLRYGSVREVPGVPPAR